MGQLEIKYFAAHPQLLAIVILQITLLKQAATITYQ